jgi:hypothetical protein
MLRRPRWGDSLGREAAWLLHESSLSGFYSTLAYDRCFLYFVGSGSGAGGAGIQRRRRSRMFSARRPCRNHDPGCPRRAAVCRGVAAFISGSRPGHLPAPPSSAAPRTHVVLRHFADSCPPAQHPAMRRTGTGTVLFRAAQPAVPSVSVRG